jgi:hypothetical protein
MLTAASRTILGIEFLSGERNSARRALMQAAIRILALARPGAFGDAIRPQVPRMSGDNNVVISGENP